MLVRAKNESQYEVDAASIRTIICSNEPPPEADFFQRRMFVVYAGSGIYETEAGASSSKSAGAGTGSVVVTTIDGMPSDTIVKPGGKRRAPRAA